MECPNCHKEVDENVTTCPECGFYISLYQQEFEKIYNEKLNSLNQAEDEKNRPKEKIIYVNSNSTVHKPRCPYCGSEDLTRITSMDKVVNIALFGILGNKRRYQWHCNNCKTNW